MNFKPHRSQLHGTLSASGLLAERNKMNVFNNIETFGFSPRVIHALHGRHIRTLHDLLMLTPTQLRRIRNIGAVSAKEITDFLDKAGLSMQPDIMAVVEDAD